MLSAGFTCRVAAIPVLAINMTCAFRRFRVRQLCCCFVVSYVSILFDLVHHLQVLHFYVLYFQHPYKYYSSQISYLVRVPENINQQVAIVASYLKRQKFVLRL